MYLGFRLLSGGLAALSFTNGYVATKPCPPGTCCPGRLYRFGDWGSSAGITSGPVALGYAFSCSRGGFRFHDQDDSGRSFPPQLAGKSVEIEVPGGFPNPGITFDDDVKFTFFDYHERSRRTLYERTYRMPIRSVFIGGIKVSGVLHEQDLTSLNNDDVYESVLDHMAW